MQFVQPIPFTEALDKIGTKSVIASDLNSSQWSAVPLDLRERAFFSSRVESVRFLQRGRDSLTDFLAGNKETLPNGSLALKTGGRADFVKQMQDFLQAEGLQRTTGGLTDITSQKRLELIFDTQTRQAQDYGYWKQGQDPDVLDAFPAQRFIRVLDVKEPRDAHLPFENAVALKSDLDFWIRINDDFGVPWGPWGWGCGHDVEDVDRDEAEQLGLIQPGDTPVPIAKDFNARLEASTKGLDPDMLRFLADAFGDQIDLEPDNIRWTGRQRTPPPTAIPTGTAPTPAPPMGQGVPTLDDALKNAGIAGKTKVTESEMRRFIEELKEDHPLQASQVLRQIVAGTTGTMSQSALTATVQEYLNFIPPQKAALLPKLNVTVKQEAGQLGSYLNGQVKLDPGLVVSERRRVTFHELSHWLHMEGDQQYKNAIKKHFRDRTVGETTKRLPGHRASTVGRKDKWYDSYAGRIYGGSFDEAEGVGIEVPTRYLELLSDPKKLAAHWENDNFRETMLIVLRGLF